MFDALRARIRARLIGELRQAHRFWSVRLSTGGAAASAAWMALPTDLRAAIPGAQWIGLALFIAIACARIVDQPETRR
jgi:hypothetical protein